MFRRVVVAGGIVALLVGGYFLVRSVGLSGREQPGVFMADRGREHVAVGTPFQYDSNPPTSGPHAGSPAEWGVYSEEIPDQVLIHNLEHGGIWIAYKPGIDPAVAARLDAITKEFGRKIIMAPRSANDADIALAAWNYLDKFSQAEFSEERVRKFIKAHINRGPEFVP